MKTHPHTLRRFPARIPQAALRAFTLVELLTVIAIIGILAAIIIPVVGGVRQRANDAKAASNLRQLAMGTQLYTQEKKAYPTTYSADAKTWQEKLLPFLGQPVPTINMSAYITKLRQDPDSIFNVPDSLPEAERASGATSIALNIYIRGLHPMLVEKPSQVIVYGECVVAASDTFYPMDGASGNKPELRRSGGTKAYMAFADGHVDTRTATQLAGNLRTEGSHWQLPNWP